MNANQGFKLHPGAVQDIAEIWEFIAEDSPFSANRVSDEILDAASNLVTFPLLGHARSDLTLRPLRFIVVQDFLVAYAPDEKPIVVIEVLHGRRNPRLLGAIPRDRHILPPDLEF